MAPYWQEPASNRCFGTLSAVLASSIQVDAHGQLGWPGIPTASTTSSFEIGILASPVSGQGEIPAGWANSFTTAPIRSEHRRETNVMQ